MPLTAVVGTGSWGCAIAYLLARGGQAAALVGRDDAKVAQLARERRHPHLDARLPDALAITSAAEGLAHADLVLWAVPTQHSRAQARRLAGALPPGVPVVSLAKGLEQGTLLRVTEVLAAELGPRAYGVLSGPSHAEEVAVGKPACLVAAGPEALAAEIQRRLHGRAMRVYTSPDLHGVELAGALKNVVAIAVGIALGLGFGDNVAAALIARGVAEMRRLGRAIGAEDGTFAGLAGIGDLIATCFSPHGRNRALGLAIAAGRGPQQYLADVDTVAEGAWTCRAAVSLGRRHGVELPIASQVESVIWDAKPVALAIEELLSRSPKEEDA